MSLSSVIKNLVSLLPLLTLQDTDGKMARLYKRAFTGALSPKASVKAATFSDHPALSASSRRIHLLQTEPHTLTMLDTRNKASD
jgi:hypothetical protein